MSTIGKRSFLGIMLVFHAVREMIRDWIDLNTKLKQSPDSEDKSLMMNRLPDVACLNAAKRDCCQACWQFLGGRQATERLFLGARGTST